MPEQVTYRDVDKVRIVALLDALGLTASDSADLAVLRQIRRRLVTRHPIGAVDVVAGGRGDWVGWVGLTTEPVTEAAVANTARVIADVNADILGVVEAEDRGQVLLHLATKASWAQLVADGLQRLRALAVPG